MSKSLIDLISILDLEALEVNMFRGVSPDDGYPRIFGGLVIAQARAIPDVGQRFAFFGYTFEIMRRQRNQITALRIVPPARQGESNELAG